MIVARALTKVFDGLTAVDSISLEIKEGERFGLLGPNGAGKTTLVSMLAAMLKPTSGSGAVNGLDIQRDREALKATMGIVFQEHSLDNRATGRENLEMVAALYGVERSRRRERINELLELVGLGERANAYVRTYSNGMKRALELARALLHEPRILFLDEPTLGLDPYAREKIWSFIRQLRGTTLLLATNYTEEAERLCDRVGIMDKGKLIVVDTPENLKRSLKGELLYLRVRDQKAIVPKLRELPFAEEVKTVGDRVVLSVRDWSAAVSSIVAVPGLRAEILSMEISRPTLNDVFMRYTGRGISEVEAGET